MMKKPILLLCFLYLLLALVPGFPLKAFSQPDAVRHRTGEQKLVSNAEACPKVWVETTPGFFKGSRADHTYVKVIHNDGTYESWSCFGANDGGTELADTNTGTQEVNIATVGLMCNEKPCMWPKYFYLVIGVCHQLANRGLYYTGKTVQGARMYGWSSFIYGTYGKCIWGLRDYCMETCIFSSGEWEPGHPDQCEAEKKPAAGTLSFENRLFEKYFRSKPLDSNEMRFRSLYMEFKNEWLQMNIRTRLGPSHPRRFEIQRLRNAMVREKDELDGIVIRRKSADEDLVLRYNRLYNEYLQMFRKMLPPKEFERLFDMPYKIEFDIRVFTSASTR